MGTRGARRAGALWTCRTRYGHPAPIELGIGGADVKRGEALRCQRLRLRWRPEEGPHLPASSPPDVVERVLDERRVVGFGPYDSLLRGAPVHRAVPALAPLADLAPLRRFARPVPARLPSPPARLLPCPVLDRSGGAVLQLRQGLRR